MKAVMYGAGNIGRGFIGQLLSQSEYEVVFLDIAKDVIDLLNKERSYPLCIVSDEGYKTITINNVRAVNSLDAEKAAEEIATADIMATSVGANVLPHIAKPVAMAIEKRIKLNSPPLNILLCENLNHAEKVFKGHLFKYLNEQAKTVFDKNIGLVEASIGRMVPVFDKNTEENPLTVYVEPFDILHLDKEGFKGGLPKIKNVVMFSPFNYFIQRKLFMHNLCHAAAAYLGSVKGYTYVSESVSDTDIKYIVLMAGSFAAKAIAKDNNEDLSLLSDFLYKLIYRFNNKNLKDTVQRVAKDPIRKLGKEDRILGALKLCKKHNISTVYIVACVAAALTYYDKSDLSSVSINNGIREKGIIKALYSVCGKNVLNKSESANLTLFYDIIKRGDYKELIKICEKITAEHIENY